MTTSIDTPVHGAQDEPAPGWTLFARGIARFKQEIDQSSNRPVIWSRREVTRTESHTGFREWPGKNGLPEILYLTR